MKDLKKTQMLMLNKNNYYMIIKRFSTFCNNKKI